MITQNRIILNHLLNHVGITAKEAFETYGIERLSARIFDIREMGFTVDSVNRVGTNRYGRKVRFTEYRLRDLKKGNTDEKKNEKKNS